MGDPEPVKYPGKFTQQQQYPPQPAPPATYGATYGQPYAQPVYAQPVYPQSGTVYVYPPQQQQAYYPAQQPYPVVAPGPTVVVIPAASVPQPSNPVYSNRMDQEIRLGFIRKVFGVLSVQLLATFGIVALFTFSDPVRTAVQTNPAILIVAIAVTFVTLIALACCPGVARSYPGNYICLGIFTLAEGYLVGAIASFYSTESVILAVGGTVVVTAGLGLFAWQTKIDFTGMSSALFAILLCFIIFGLFVAIDRSHIMRAVYAGIGLLLFSLFLVIDVQMVVGGSREITYGPDEYIFAALNIYIDIIQIFLFLLRIFGSARN